MIVTIVAGNLTRDPELRNLNDGTPVTSLRLACNRKFGRDAVFINVSIFGKDAEHVCKYLRKGRAVKLYGELTPVRIYNTKAGETRADYEMDADRGSVEFGSKNDDGVSGGKNVRDHQYRPDSTPGKYNQDATPDAPDGPGDTVDKDEWMPF